MDAIGWLSLWGVLVVVTGIAGSVLARRKNRDASAWTAWCVIFPPSLAVLALLSRRAAPPPRRPTLDEQDHDSRFP